MVIVVIIYIYIHLYIYYNYNIQNYQSNSKAATKIIQNRSGDDPSQTGCFSSLFWIVFDTFGWIKQVESCILEVYMFIYVYILSLYH